MADIETREYGKYEGRTSIALRIKKHLKSKGYEFVDNVKDADLIHVHTSGIAGSYKAYEFKKRYKIPCIFTLYSTAETEPIRHIVNYFTQRRIGKKYKISFLLSYSGILPIKLRGIFLSFLDRVVVASEYSKKKLYKNTELIHFGIDLNKFRPLKKSSHKKIKVGYFGHPGVFKGVTDFIKASKYFSDNIESYLYPTRLPKDFLKYVKKKNKKIKVMGPVKDINKAYNKMDIIVLPFRYTIGAIMNPLVLLEAMAAKSAIVTTKLPTIKEIVKDSAISVKTYSPKEIAKAVNRLAKDPILRKKLGEKARKIVEKEYNEKDMLKKYEKLYKELKTK